MPPNPSEWSDSHLILSQFRSNYTWIYLTKSRKNSVKSRDFFKFGTFLIKIDCLDRNWEFWTENLQIIIKNDKFSTIVGSSTFRKIEIEIVKNIGVFQNRLFSSWKSALFRQKSNILDRKSSLSSKNFNNRKFCQLFEKIEIENSIFSRWPMKLKIGIKLISIRFENL